MNATSPKMTACLRIFSIAACTFLAEVTTAQLIVPSGEQFRTLGIDGNGQVWILGKCITGPCDNDHALFQFTGDGFETMRLVPLPNTAYAEALRISRDGQYIVGFSHGDGFDEPTLWSLQETLAPKSLNNTLEFREAKPRDVASSATGPIVVGYYGFGTFLWSEGTGYQAWMTNSEFWPIRRAYVVSADGTKWAGEQ